MTIEIWDKLYKADKKAGTRVWWCEIDDDKIRTVAGLLDGEKVESGWKQMKVKNAGKANATTTQQQARAEVQALYDKKLAQGGYHRDIADAGDKKYVMPMLAAVYADSLPLNFESGLFSQPKLDGMRCIATKDGLFSRKGKRWMSVPHIDFALIELFQQLPDVILDGELYNHDLHDDFDSLSSILRKQKNISAEDLERSAQIAQYHVYDMVSYDGALFSERWITLDDVLDQFKPAGVFLVDTEVCNDMEDIERVYGGYLEQGYEGQIVRYNTTYQLDRRHKSVMIKRKEFFDEEFQIDEVVEGEGNWAGHAKAIIYRMEDGRKPSSGIRGTKEKLKEVWDNRESYRDGTATIRFPNKTPSGIPRFPVATQIFQGKREF